MSDDNLIKMTVNVTETAFQALNRTAEMTGHSRTDSVSRALVVYESICAAKLAGKRQELTVIDFDGVALRLVVE